MELKDEELGKAVGGCYYKHEDGSITEVFYDDAPDEGVATFANAYRSMLSVGGKEGTHIVAITDNGLVISGIMADGNWGEGQMRFKKIDIGTEGGFAQYWFYKI